MKLGIDPPQREEPAPNLPRSTECGVDVRDVLTREPAAGVIDVELDAEWPSADAALHSRALTYEPPHHGCRIFNTPIG